jgi:hypothetical protein
MNRVLNSSQNHPKEMLKTSSQTTPKNPPTGQGLKSCRFEKQATFHKLVFAQLH